MAYSYRTLWVAVVALIAAVTCFGQHEHDHHHPDSSEPPGPRPPKVRDYGQSSNGAVNMCTVYGPDEVDGLVGERLTYSYARPGLGYWADKLGVLTVGMNVPLFRSVGVTSITDGEFILGAAGGGHSVTPVTRNSQYMFGIGQNGGFYRTTDGVDWVRLSDLSSSNLFALADDSILRTYWDGDRTAVSRSSDHGVTWTRAQWAGGGPTDFVCHSPGAYVVHWGLHQAANGTIMMVEYELPKGGRYIYRSTDSGRTWSTVYDAGDDVITHFHAVVKHEATGRWIATTGDGLHRQMLMASDDDGLNWYRYSELGEVYAQPTFLMDYGDPTRLLIGSDLFWQTGWMDISDEPTGKTLGSFITNWSSDPSGGYAFVLFRHAGLYYAAQYDGRNVWEKHPVLSVSPDLEHWAVHHRFTDWERGIFSYAGAAAGRLHAVVARDGGSQKPFAFTPPEFAIQPGLLVGRREANLSPDTSSPADVAAWGNSSPVDPGTGSQGTLEYVSGGAHSGDGYLRASRADGQKLALITPSFAFQPGHSYQARVWMRGDGGTCSVRWRRNHAGYDLAYYLGLSPEWREVVLPAVKIDASTYALAVDIALLPTLNNDCTIEIDSLQFQEAPGAAWTPPNATPVSQSMIEATRPDARAWTNVFVFEPDNASWMLRSGVHPIKSYVYGPNAALTLFFDADQQRFGLQSVIGGVPQEPAYSAPQHFLERAQLKLAVRYSDWCAGLVVCNGQPPSEAFTVGLPRRANYDLTIRFGNPTGGNGLPGAVANDVFYDDFLSNAAVASAMNDVEPPAGLGDLNDDRRCDLDDLFILLADFGGVDGDLNGDRLTLLDDLIVLLGNLGTVSP